MLVKKSFGLFEIILAKDEIGNGFVRAVRGFRVVRVTISIHLDWQHSKQYLFSSFQSA